MYTIASEGVLEVKFIRAFLQAIADVLRTLLLIICLFTSSIESIKRSLPNGKVIYNKCNQDGSEHNNNVLLRTN